MYVRHVLAGVFGEHRRIRREVVSAFVDECVWVYVLITIPGWREWEEGGNTSMEWPCRLETAIYVVRQEGASQEEWGLSLTRSGRNWGSSNGRQEDSFQLSVNSWPNAEQSDGSFG